MSRKTSWSFGNFKISTDNGMFHGCLRATKDQSKRLYNCKDGLLFFRPFVRRGETPPEEAGTVIIWSKFDTISALSLVANTLSGIHGFVATKGSIGVRSRSETYHSCSSDFAKAKSENLSCQFACIWHHGL